MELIEMFSKKSCPANDLPFEIATHTMCGNLLCGGTPDIPRSCYRIDRGFHLTKLNLTLLKPRTDHQCWTLDNNDVLLMGGGTTTELVKSDGSSSSLSFTLAHSS